MKIEKLEVTRLYLFCMIGRHCFLWNLFGGCLQMGVFENSGTSKSSIFNRVFHYKPSILRETPLFFGNTQMVGCFNQQAILPVRNVDRRRRRFRTVLASPPLRRSVVPRSYRAVAKGGWYTGKLAAKLKKDISWKIHGKIIENVFFFGGVRSLWIFLGEHGHDHQDSFSHH